MWTIRRLALACAATALAPVASLLLAFAIAWGTGCGIDTAQGARACPVLGADVSGVTQAFLTMGFVGVIWLTPFALAGLAVWIVAEVVNAVRGKA
jgi:hypothetical protein